MNPGGNAGNLCLGGKLGRFVGPTDIITADGFGSGSIRVDLNMMPQPSGFVQVQPGDVWNFTCTIRDGSPTGGVTFNFANGLEVMFQ